MQTLDSKTHFLKISDDSAKVWLTEAMNSSAARTAMVFAFSQLAEEGASKEQLDGARRYRDLLINLAEPKPKPVEFPEKKLQTLG